MSEPPERLPDFLCLGAQRAGSTWLYELLRAHPQIYVPSRRKEIHYFDWYYHRGLEWYRRFFRDSKPSQRARGEVTPDYLYLPEGPARIRSTLPRCRLIVILRNPVDRAISHYGLLVRDEGLREGFWEATRHRPEILERGFYSRYLRSYLECFSPDRLLLLIFERATQDPAATKHVLAQFLGVEESLFPPGAGQERLNESYVPKARNAYSVAVRVSRLLHRIDLDWPVRVLRAMGVRRLFGSRRSDPAVSPDDRLRLAELYQGEAEALQSLVRLEPGLWVPERRR